MIIPKTTKNTKQFKLNSFATYLLVISFVMLNIFISITSVVYYNKYQVSDNKNTYMSSSNSTKTSAITVLEETNESLVLTISELSDKNQDVLDYLNAKIIEVNNLKSELSETISTFNVETNSDISVPISRSLDSASISNIYKSRNFDDETASPDLDEMKKQDELSAVIDDIKTESDSLVSEIEGQLDFLECLPDYVPVVGRISSGFGYRIHPITRRRSFHNGIDIQASRGTPVHAAGSGVVVFSGYSGGFGKVIIISHGYGYETVYAHNNKLYVEVNDIVTKGDIISEVGSTGNSTGPHLHFEIHIDDEIVNPKSILKFN